MARSGSRKPAAEQLALDFTSRNRERYLLVEAIGFERSGLTRTRWRHVAELLKKIQACSGADDWSDAYAATLADRCGVSLRTLHRARGDAVALDLLEIQETYDRRGRGRNRWRVRWDQVARIGLGAAAAPPARAGECQCVPSWHEVSAKLARGECQVGTAYIRNNPTFNPTFNPPPPTPASPTDTATSRRTDPHSPWRVVVEEVFGLGVDRAELAVQAARGRGATPEAVRELIAWWRDHRGGFDHAEVVLYRRICRWDADQAVCDGWPTFRAGYRSPEVERERRQEIRRKRLSEKHRATIESWTPEFKRRLAERIVRAEPAIAGDGRAIYGRVLELLETRELAEHVRKETANG